MGYQGLVISDWWAMPGDQNVPADTSIAQSVTNDSVNAGLDIEVPWTLHYSPATLANADQDLVKDAARRVLRQKFRFKTATTNDGWSLTAPKSTLKGASIDNPDHQALAEKVEIHSAVLLQNGPADAPVLPLTADAKNIAVVGPDEEFSLVSSSVPKSCVGAPQRGPCTYHFATDPSLGDRGSARVNGDPATTIGPFAGIQTAAGRVAHRDHRQLRGSGRERRHDRGRRRLHAGR